MSETTVAVPCDELPPAVQFAPTVLAHGRRTRGRPLVVTPAGAVAVAPNGLRCTWDDYPARSAIYRHRDRLILADLDTVAEHRTVAHLLAEREVDTERPVHVAWHTGGVTAGYQHMTVVIADPDPAWRAWFMAKLHRAHPRTARWGHQLTRPPGTHSVKDAAEEPDGLLYGLTALGTTEIDLTEARRRVRDRGRSSAEAGTCTAEYVDLPPYKTRSGRGFDSSRSVRSTAVPQGDSVAVSSLLASLPTWAQTAAAVDAPVGARSDVELAVCRGAAVVGLTPADLHRVLCAVPAGARWRSTGGSVARADARLRASTRWLDGHPGGRVVDEAVRAQVVAAWDAILADAAQVGLPATRWVVLLNHRALAIAEAGWAWLGSVRDLGVGVDRKLLPAIRGDLARWVAVERAGAGGRGREATLWKLPKRWRSECVTLPHESTESVNRMREFADHVVDLVAGDLWAPATGTGRRAATAETALLVAALTVGLPLDDLQAMAGVSSLRHWTARAAALGLVARDGQRSPWRLGEDLDVVADRIGATGRAAAQDDAIRHERAVHAEVVGLLTAGRTSEVGRVHARERARTAAKTGRAVNPGRHGQRLGDNEVVELWEDPGLGLITGLTSRDLREGAAALVDGWTNRWVDGDDDAKRGVHAEIEAWRRASDRHRAEAPLKAQHRLRRAVGVIRPWSDEDAVQDDGDTLVDPLAVHDPVSWWDDAEALADAA